MKGTGVWGAFERKRQVTEETTNGGAAVAAMEGGASPTADGDVGKDK